MLNKKVFRLVILSIFSLVLIACNPYRAFKGVDTSEIRGGNSPSQKIHKAHKKQEKKATKRYNKEMKKRKKRMGS